MSAGLLTAPTLDKARPGGRPGSGFVRARKLEATYATQLRKVARQIGDLVRGLNPTDPTGASRLDGVLTRYAETIRPWAEAVSGLMIAEVSRRDEKAWSEMARGMARSLRDELRNAPTGAATRRLLADQVELITSLPTEAAARVHRLTLHGLTTGARASEVAAEIMRTGEVTQARANLIARTEVARTASVLTQARAEHVGSDGYIWRTSGDSDVRKSHKAMNGKFVRWADAPVLDGMTGHAGCLPNCRCFPEPVVPET